jgi:TolB-like protein/DNA-binding winged helix-turn-helix (wHTH) protein/Tfp pilus assembly protein PilF
MPAPALIYRFGFFELRPRTRELYKAGNKLRLRPQPFQVLQLLAERAGDVVSREELRESLWSKETFVDFEHGLNTSIKELRGVLSDSASKPRYIETLPKLGYRFVVPVEVEEPPLDEVEDQPQTKPAENLGGERSTSERLPQAPAVRRWPMALAVSLVLITALGTYLQWSRSRPRFQAPVGRAMLAVLPFENLTGDASQEYFSDGLTEEMIAQLGRLDPQHLGVIGRTSVMHYKHSQTPLQQIGRELGIQYVLEGSVRREADKVRVSAQLIQLRDQTHVWARQYDRELSNLLTLQGEIAQETARGIQLTLGNHDAAAPVSQVAMSAQAYEAYNLYLKGQYFWNKRTVEGFQEAIKYFEQATAKDPNCARAYAGLADSYALIGGYSGFPQKDYDQKARAAARRGLDIDDNLPETHTAWALVVQNYNWDWQTAEKEFRRAIELNPNYATAHHWYAEHLMTRGRFDEALHESELARQLDPLSLIIAADNGAILFYSRQYDRAIEQFRYVLDLDSGFPRAQLIRLAYIQKGMYAEDLALLDKQTPSDDDPGYWAELAYVYGRSGRHAEAQRALEKLLQLSRRRQLNTWYLVEAYIGVSDGDQALGWLQWASSHQPDALTGLKVDPIYDPLRGDPRFQSLLRRAGLAQ